MPVKNIYILICFSALIFACGKKSEPKQTKDRSLPYLGEPAITSHEENGKLVADTIYPTIPAFSFVNQDGEKVTNETFDGGIYVADFFFTTCPTICPKMKAELLRVYKEFEKEPKVKILSHTIDPDHDSVEVLYDYAGKLQVTSPKWNFVTGNKDSIYTIADSYMISAEEAPNEPGGYIHSGALILIDHNRNIRGMYDGTRPEDVDQLIKDIPVLLREIK